MKGIVKTIIFQFAVFSVIACTPIEKQVQVKHDSAPENKVAPISVADEMTYANVNDVRVKHVDLTLTTDFKSKKLSGTAELQLVWLRESTTTIKLDTRDLTISDVRYWHKNAWLPGQFSLQDADPVKGAALVIELPVAADKVMVEYATSPKASGLQWLDKEQTAGKQHPFMYSQSQAIHARSWIPIQDTPAVRVTYSAKITTPSPLTAVMSATSNGKVGTAFEFSMPQPIPAYLIAIAVGELEYQAMSRQTGIWAEPSVLASAVAEFDDTQAMIDATEKLYGPYRWQQYDLLILPPAFPFGGMENPRLSFITPTVIAGDKSLVNLIAHELAHSWSGNLVTNATWNDLWLNEGFTSYVENRIMEEVFGEQRAVMEQWLSVAGLKRDLKALPAADTRLRIELKGRDPDDAFSDVPYVKGHMFLLYLEQAFGRDKFDPFIRYYFDKYAFQSISTDQFVKELNSQLLNKYPGIVSLEMVNQWIDQPGLPESSPNPQSDAFVKVQQYQQAWLNRNLATAALKQVNWTVHEWLYFIEILPANLTMTQMRELDRQLGFTQSTNAEIQFAWFRYAISQDYVAVEPAVKTFLQSVGRKKFIVPLYQLLADSSTREYEWAKGIYAEARATYHPMAQSSIDPIFKQK